MKSEDFIQLRLLLGTYVTVPFSFALTQIAHQINALV